MAIRTARDAANDDRVLLLGRLLGAANALEFLAARELEQHAGVDHAAFEVLLLLGRAGPDGLPGREIAQSRVLTSGGVTRLVQRMEDAGLVQRRPDREDGRVQRVVATTAGEHLVVRAARIHVDTIERHIIERLGLQDARVLGDLVRRLSQGARGELPVMP